MSESANLARATRASLSTIRQQIAHLVEAGDVPGLSDLRAKAKAVEVYVQEQTQDLADAAEVQRCAAELVIRIERGIGDVLRTLVRPGNFSRSGPKPARLDDLGITRKQSSRWQLLAALPEDVFESRLVDAARVGGRLGTAAVLRPEQPAVEQPPSVADVARRYERWGDEWCVQLAHELLARSERRAS